MYKFPVKRMYWLDSVAQDPRAMARARRLSNALGVASSEMMSRGEFRERAAEWARARSDSYPRRTGSFDYSGGWTVVLGTYAEGGDVGEDLPLVGYRSAAEQAKMGGICRSGLELHCAYGCYHRCAYCFCDPHFLIAVDLERLAEALPGYFARYPSQLLFKFDNLTDTIALEPELGASDLLVRSFAESDRYLLLYTKSDNVEHLLDIPHKGRTIVNWSLSPLTQSRVIEVNAPEMPARIGAMRRCQKAGYTIRARFSPIVPLVGWRDEMTGLVDLLFSSVRPDVISIDVVGWCQARALAEAMDISLLESPFREHVGRLAREGHEGTDKYLFPHEMRLAILEHAVREIRRRAGSVPVALCNETAGMWEALGHELSPMTPANYACTCGPDCVPDHPLLARGNT